MAARGATILLTSILAFMPLATPQAAYAQQEPGEGDPIRNPATVNGKPTGSEESETERRIDEIMEAVDELVWQNNQLRASSANDKNAQDAIERNDEAILRLMKQLDVLAPPIPVAEVSGSDRAKLNAAMERLAKSGLPLLEMGIDPPTGSLGIMIDVDRAGPDTEKRIREIAAGVDLEITYGADAASFQTASPGQRAQPANALISSGSAYELARNKLLIEAGHLALQMRLTADEKRLEELGTKYGGVLEELEELGVGLQDETLESSAYYFAKYEEALKRLEDRGHPATAGAGDADPGDLAGMLFHALQVHLTALYAALLGLLLAVLEFFA